MDDDEFFLSVWRYVGITIVICAISVSSCVSNTHYQIRREIEHGASPLEVACAHGQDNSAASCAVLAARSNATK